MEARRLESALTAKTSPVSETERDRVNAGFDSLRAELSVSVNAANAEDKARRRSLINAGNEHFGAPDDGLPNLTFEQMCAERGIDPASIRDAPARADGFDRLKMALSGKGA